MKDPDEIATIWSEELQTAAKKILAHEVLGTTPAQKKFEIEVELPAPIAEAIIKASHATGLDVNEVIGGMASEGLNQFLMNKLTGFKEPAEDPVEQVPQGPALNSLDQLGAVTGQVAQLAEMMKNVTSALSAFNLPNQANSQQPDVPDREVAEGKSSQDSDD